MVRLGLNRLEAFVYGFRDGKRGPRYLSVAADRCRSCVTVSQSLPPIDIAPSAWEPESAVEWFREHLTDRYNSISETDPELTDRIDAHLADAWTAFSSVYGADASAAGWFVRAVDAAVDGFHDRPERLRRLDRERGRSPDWFQAPHQVGFTCYVDRFAGTLDGVRDKIPYLKELGVTYLHLMPLLKTREGRDDGGYAVQDYRAVQPRLGTIEDLDVLAQALHEEGILLALDFVMNHTGSGHEWARAACAGEDRYRDFYLTYEDRTVPDQFEETVQAAFPRFTTGNFTYVEAMDRWVWSSFNDFQWDLDYSNPDVFVQMLREMLAQANVGGDVLRLDAVPFLWKELGTNCRNLPECHWILRAYRALTRIAAPGVLFKAEAITAPEEILRYLGTDEYEGKECDIAYNATLMSHLWHALASENVQLLRTALTNLPRAPETATWLNYVRSHDDIGWGLDDADVRAVGQDPADTRRYCARFYAGKTPDSYAEGYHFQVENDGSARTSGTTAALTGLQKAFVEGEARDVDRALRRTLLVHNVIFAARGMPLLYSGDEIGQLNDLSYLTDETKAEDNRWVHRPPMNWDRARLRHEEGRIEKRLFDELQRFACTRKTLSALHGGGQERILQGNNDQVFLLERMHEDEHLLVASNFSGTPQAVSISALAPTWQRTAFTDVLHDQSVVFSSGRLVLPPYGYLWLQPDESAAPGEPVRTPIEVEVHTEWGEQVYLCGNLEALGTGDPRHALGPLSADDYPVWRTEIDVPADTYFEFQWIKKREGRTVEWSPCGYAMKAGHQKAWRLEEPA